MSMTLAETNAFYVKREIRLFSYYQSTKYPIIFRNSYWGGCSGDIPTNTILENRNNFVEKCNISDYKRFSDMTQKTKKKTFIFHDQHYNKVEPPKGLHRECFKWDAGMSKDHKEHYTIKGTNGKSFVALFSQLKCHILHNAILDHGYVEVPPLYNEGLITYMKIIHPDTE